MTHSVFLVSIHAGSPCKKSQKLPNDPFLGPSAVFAMPLTHGVTRECVRWQFPGRVELGLEGYTYYRFDSDIDGIGFIFSPFLHHEKTVPTELELILL